MEHTDNSEKLLSDDEEEKEEDSDDDSDDDDDEEDDNDESDDEDSDDDDDEDDDEDSDDDESEEEDSDDDDDDESEEKEEKEAQEEDAKSAEAKHALMTKLQTKIEKRMAEQSGFIADWMKRGYEELVCWAMHDVHPLTLVPMLLPLVRSATFCQCVELVRKIKWKSGVYLVVQHHWDQGFIEALAHCHSRILPSMRFWITDSDSNRKRCFLSFPVRGSHVEYYSTDSDFVNENTIAVDRALRAQPDGVDVLAMDIGAIREAACVAPFVFRVLKRGGKLILRVRLNEIHAALPLLYDFKVVRLSRTVHSHPVTASLYIHASKYAKHAPELLVGLTSQIKYALFCADMRDMMKYFLVEKTHCFKRVRSIVQITHDEVRLKIQQMNREQQHVQEKETMTADETQIVSTSNFVAREACRHIHSSKDRIESAHAYIHHNLLAASASTSVPSSSS